MNSHEAKAMEIALRAVSSEASRALSELELKLESKDKQIQALNERLARMVEAGNVMYSTTNYTADCKDEWKKTIESHDPDWMKARLKGAFMQGQWKAFSECQDEAKKCSSLQLFEWCRAKGAEAFHESPDAPKIRDNQPNEAREEKG